MTRALERLVKGWAKGDLPPVYSFLGADQFSQMQAVGRLRAELAGRAGLSREEVELLRFQGKEAEAETVLEALTDISLFGGVKLLAVEEVQALSTEEWKKLGAELKRHFGRAPSPPPASPLLVLTSSEPNVRRDRGPSRLTEFQKRVEGAVRAEFPPPSWQELPGVLSKMAKEMGVALAPAEARHLAGRVGGTELRLYHGELAKLAAYAYPEETIDKEMIDAVASRAAYEASPYLIFDFADLIVQGRLPKVMESVKRLLALGETPLGIVAMLARHLRQLRRAVEMARPQGGGTGGESGARPDSTAGGLAKEVGVPLFVARKLLSQAKSAVPERLDEALLLCARADVQLKRTTEAIPLFEVMMCRMTRLFASGR